MYSHQDSNIRKTWLLMALFFVVVIGIGWVFSYVYQSPGILYIFVGVSILMNIVSYWYSDKIVLKMYRAVPVTNESHPDLYNIVENLSITAGLPMPKVYVIPEAQPNAFATGRNKEHAAVAVTAGLLEILNRSELEGVIAHELAHIGNRDILLSTVVVVLVGFVSLISDFFLRSHILGVSGGSGDRDNRAQGILMIIGIVFAILSPFIALLIQLAISRKREFLADASGALLTRYPEGLASALEKISSYSGVQMKRANNATAHLFISNPFGIDAHAHEHDTGQPRRGMLGGFSKLFMTHPPAADRIKILRGM
jgi:heat shock protein HtpX